MTVTPRRSISGRILEQRDTEQLSTAAVLAALDPTIGITPRALAHSVPPDLRPDVPAAITRLEAEGFITRDRRGRLTRKDAQ